MDAEQGGGAPAWLFSFVDLAFLMLIAMTQLAGDVGAEPPDLGEIVVPRIGEDGAPADLTADAGKGWQLRIYPKSAPDAAQTGAFALMRAGTAPEEVVRGDIASIRDHVATLLKDGENKPLLAPHEDSRSQDLLDAVALLEEHWPGRRRALVARISEF
ncbi:MAG: hypothetical protein ACI8W3_002504 [Myxococcota bacterium]|jgi:hypothetical protein